MAECQLAIVGCGGIADAYAKALLRMPNARLAAVVDPDAAARTRIAGDDASIAQHANIERLAQVDAALVLAPPNVHEELSCALLQRGMHVLCEKPLAPTVDAAKRMLKCAETAGRRLMMGSKFRYTADVTKARALLDDNVCGDIVIYENVFCSHVDMSQRWNSQAAISGGGVLIDNGCHSVDLARYLLGPLAKVQAQFGTRVQPLAVEDTARMLFQSQSGALGSIDLSWSIRKETDAYVRLHGTKGTLEIGWRGSRWKTTDGAWQEFGSGYDKIGAFQAQLENFVACVTGDAAAVIGDTDAMASVVVIDCAYQSAQQERWVTIPV
ncbi:MAG: putative dehydrogenase [Planctomycetota bacterium]|jgi:predicted dehydrogenase